MLQMTKHDEKQGARDSSPRSSLPQRSASDLSSLVSALTALSALGHERLTVRQALFFFAVAYHRAMGETVSIPRLQEIYEPLGRSIEKSKEQFLEPTKRFPDALGWIEQHIDEDDRRMRYLDLSEEGVEVVGTLIEALRAG